MILHRFSFVFVFAISTLAAASQPGQEDSPLPQLLYVDKIWPHAELGNSSLNLNAARDQLFYAKAALETLDGFVMQSNSKAVISFYSEVVRRKQAQLDYVHENSDALFEELRKQKIAYQSAKESRKKCIPNVVYTKKKQ